MIVESKFDIGDKVYYWSIKEVKVLCGNITYIHIMADKEKTKFSYGLKKAGEEFSFSEDIPEHLVFKEREDVFDFCMELTKDI